MGDVSFRIFAGPPGSSSLTALSESAQNALAQIEVEETLNLATILRLRFSIAVRQDGAAWTLVDDDLFSRLSRVRVTVSTGSDAQVLIDGHVVEMHAEFSSEPGKSKLEVLALDGLLLLSLEEKIRDFPSKNDSVVASTIFQEYGFTPVVASQSRTPSPNDVTLIQRGTDLEFLRHLAARNGYELFLESSGSPDAQLSPPEAHFGPPRFDRKLPRALTVNITGVSNVDSFRIKFRPLRSAQVRAKVFDAAGFQLVSSELAQSPQDLLGRERPDTSDHPRVLLDHGSAAFTSDEIGPRLAGISAELDHVVSAEGELSAAAYGGVLRTRRLVRVRGVGTHFSGFYYVERVLHVIQPGSSYKQHFTLRRNALGARGDEHFEQEEVA